MAGVGLPAAAAVPGSCARGCTATSCPAPSWLAGQWRQCHSGLRRRPLSPHRTRILVTNQLQYARPADRILYVAEGRVVESGTYDELMAAGGGFATLMSQTEVPAPSLCLLDCCARVRRASSIFIFACTLRLGAAEAAAVDVVSLRYSRAPDLS